MTEDNPDTEPKRGTFTAEVDGLDGQITGEVELHETTPAPDPEPDNRYEFTGEGLQLRSTAHTPPMRYSFTVDGVQGGESLEDADMYEERDDGRYYVEGTIGPRGSDTYFITGKLADWSAEHVETDEAVPQTRYEVAVAGEPRELHKLLDEPAPRYNDVGPEAIGGGAHYSEKVTEEDADVVVTSHDELLKALATAESGDVVFVDPATECYSPRKSERYVIPAGVTLASNRGVDGSEGALLHTDAPYSYGAHGLVSAQGDDARVTGLRIRGPHPDVDWFSHTYDYEQSGINARSNGAARVEVDNCEIWGFAHLVASGTDGHVHHNSLHHANMTGLGYCTSTGNTEGTIFEFNDCWHWRHVVAAGGKGGYEARFNRIDGPSISHAFDQHSPGGSYSDIHHNTHRGGRQVDNNKHPILAAFRGSNVRNAEVNNNWVPHNPQEPRETPSGWTDEVIIRVYDDGKGWEGVSWRDNHLRESEPAEDIGCPR